MPSAYGTLAQRVPHPRQPAGKASSYGFALRSKVIDHVQVGLAHRLGKPSRCQIAPDIGLDLLLYKFAIQCRTPAIQGAIADGECLVLAEVDGRIELHINFLCPHDRSGQQAHQQHYRLSQFSIETLSAFLFGYALATLSTSNMATELYQHRESGAGRAAVLLVTPPNAICAISVGLVTIF